MKLETTLPKYGSYDDIEVIIYDEPVEFGYQKDVFKIYKTWLPKGKNYFECHQLPPIIHGTAIAMDFYHYESIWYIGQVHTHPATMVQYFLSNIVLSYRIKDPELFNLLKWNNSFYKMGEMLRVHFII